MSGLRVAVLFDTAGFLGSLPLTGAAARTFHLNRHLRRTGCDVRLFLGDFNPVSQRCDSWPFQVTYLRYADLYGDPTAVIDELRCWQPQVLVMSNTQLLVRWGRCAADTAGSVLVYEMHDDEQALLHSIGAAERRYREAGSLQAAAVRLVDGVVAFTSDDANTATALGAACVHIVPCGAETAGPAATHTSPPSPAVFVGNLYYEPNRRALTYLRQHATHISAPIDVYGRYPPALCRQNTAGLRLHGAAADLNDALRHASIGLAPLDSGSGMKLKTLQYMAAGLPVVGTPGAFAGIPEAADIGLTARTNLSDFCDLTNKLLSDPGQRSRLGTRGRQLAATKYSWEAVAAVAAGAYEQIARQRPAIIRPPVTAQAVRLAEARPYWLTEWLERSDASHQTYLARRGPAAVRLKASATQARWMQEHLAPYIDITLPDPESRDQPNWTVSLNYVEQPSETRVTSDRGASSHDIGYHLTVDSAQRTISILPGEPEVELTQCRRLIRSILRHELLGHGSIHLNAALVAAESAGSAVALVGGPRTGKTSTALALLLTSRFALCANDDLTISAVGNNYLGLGWPRAASLRRATLRQFARSGTALRDAFLKARHPGLGKPHERITDRALWLFPDELANATGTSLLPQAPITAIIFPTFDATTSTPRLTTLPDTSEVAHRLAVSADLTPGHYEPWLASHFPALSPTAVAEVCAGLAGSLPAFDLIQSMTCLDVSATLIEKFCFTEDPMS